MRVAPPPIAAQSGGENPVREDSPVGTSPLGVDETEEETGDEEKSFADTKELNVNFIGPAVALPSSSYFSSHEVFIAEERLSRHRSRLIKLIYEFLPYQRRLSDYGPNYPTVDGLHATRDRSCDETVMHMTSSANTRGWPQADQSLDSKYLKQQQRTLACYRTTADDYRIARTRRRR